MSWPHIKLIFFLLFLSCAVDGFAQQPELEFNTVDVLENYSGNKTIAIIQDSVGFLWIATEDGLFRFDGQSVQTYMHKENDPYSLPNNKTELLFIDHNKTVWISTSAGLCSYNPEMDTFTPFISESNLRGSAGVYINAIAEDKNGQLYIANENEIFKYNLKSDRFSKVTEIPSGKITNLVFDDRNNIWISATQDGGLYYFDQKKIQLSPFLNIPNNPQSVTNNEIFDIELIGNKLWIAVYGGGIDTYDTVSKTFKHYFSPYYYENYSLNIFADSKNQVWVSTLGSLKLYDPVTDNFFNYYHDPNNPKSLHKNLWRFYEDRNGNYWTIHSIGGIRFVKSDNKFKHYTTQPINFWSTSENNITAITNDQYGNLWLGNYYNGIDVFKWKENKIDRYVHLDNDHKSLGNGTIFNIFRDSKQNMWVGSNMGGLQRFNPRSKNFTNFKNNPNDSTSIANNDVRSIDEDPDGNIWLIPHGKGVDRFDPKTGTFHHYNSKNSQLTNDYAFQVLIDSNQNLWVASVYGLNLLKKGESKFLHYLSVPNDTTSLNGNEIHSIYEDRNHSIWVSTADGLNRFNAEKNNFTRYTPSEKFKHIVSILSDKKNNIWCSTTSGILKLEANTGKFRYFDQSNGLLSKEYYGNSCFIDDANEIYFGGLNGVDVFNPDSLLKSSKKPTLVFTDFKLFNTSVSALKDSLILQKHINYAKRVDLKYVQNTISILYQGVDLTNPSKISYAYKLDGFDQDWNYVEGKREANYTNLHPGKYTFRVKASYTNNEWTENDISFDLYIHPVWWMTAWFRILAGIILFITPFLIVYWRMNRLHSQRRLLEKLVNERTFEIQSKNKMLHDLNETKDKLFSIISHDLRSPFNTILGFQDILINNYSEFSDSERKKMIRNIHISSSQIYYLLENLLNWAKIQANNIQYNPAKIVLKELFEEEMVLYKNMASIKGITLNYVIKGELISFADLNYLKTILRNLISNAIKFTPKGGTIQVVASHTEGYIEISVIDSGVGMSTHQIDHFFKNSYNESKIGTNGELGSGLGLVLCKEFIEKNKGKLSIKSQQGIGSTFSFTVPEVKQ
ncbi:MAG: two-component regulator propeller domain-containing protein [Prolixibacteraceae bacterium]